MSTPFFNPIRVEDLIHGYVRASTSFSREDQVDALKLCDAIHEEGPGKRKQQVLTMLLVQLQAGDTLAVTLLDRLGLPVARLLSLVQSLHTRGVALRVLTSGIDTTTDQGRIFISTCAALAELDSDLSSERDQQRSEVPNAGGARSGRPQALTPQKLEKARDLLNAGMSHAHVALNLGVSRSMLYRAFPPEGVSRQTDLF